MKKNYKNYLKEININTVEELNAYGVENAWLKIKENHPKIKIDGKSLYKEVIEKNSCMLSKILELYGNESILNKEIEEGIVKF